MPLPLSDDTRIKVRLEGEIIQDSTTLGLFLADNFLSADEQRALREGLASTASTYRGGGGAQPEWSVEIAR